MLRAHILCTVKNETGAEPVLDSLIITMTSIANLAFFRLSIAAIAITLTASSLAAQTDYYNTDAGRPVQIEDAYATERYAFELKLAPVRLERGLGGVYNFGVEPEIAYGILPRTHVEIGLPVAYVDLGGGGSRSGVAGVELSAFHNLNVETRTLPALGLRADVLLPVGPLGPEKVYTSLKSIATRTFSFARFHLNGQYTFGSSTGEDSRPLPPPAEAQKEAGALEVSRWLVGAAVDKTFPLRAMLVTADFFARQSVDEAEDVDYNIGTGLRYQINPRFNVDGGVGRRINGPDQGWFVTFGTAYAFAVRSLLPGSAR